PSSQELSSDPTAAPPRVWLLITRQRIWDEFKRQSAWSFHQQSLRQAERISPGDLGIVYLTKDVVGSSKGVSRLVGLVEITGRVNASPQGAKGSYFYIYPMPFRLVREMAEPVPFIGLVPSLSFIYRKD